MITFTRLGKMGRLGNQIAQMATTISTAINHDDDFIFPKWRYDDYFSIPKAKFQRTPIRNAKDYVEDGFKFKEIKIENSKNGITNLVGYFQSPKYWNQNVGQLKSYFFPKEIPPIQYGKTALHIRRGDYLSLTDHYEQLSKNYYENAISKIASNKYVIFSDDMVWAKANFIGSQFEYSEGKSDINDFIYMMSMENFIIANSSFSLMAAYLSLNPLKKVIAPQKWFGPKMPHDTSDLLPTDWIKI